VKLSPQYYAKNDLYVKNHFCANYQSFNVDKSS